MFSCSEVHFYFAPIIRVVLNLIVNLRHNDHQFNINVDELIQNLERHAFNQFRIHCNLLREQILQYINDNDLPRSISRAHHFLADALNFFSTDLISAMFHLCKPTCRYYVMPPIAEAQSGVPVGSIRWDDNLTIEEHSEEENDANEDDDDGIHVIYQVTQNFQNLEISSSETINDPPPVYDYPPNYELAVSDTVLPLYFIRYGLEVFEVLWDLLLNEPNNPDTVKYDMYDFQDVQSKRDQIMQSVSGDITLDTVIDTLRLLENLFDQVQWYGRRRTEEYFRRHNQNAVEPVFAHHVSCPACCSQMLHCYKEQDFHQTCANPHLCQRFSMRSYFQPQVLIPYGPLFHIIAQRKIFGIQKTFNYYAQDGDNVMIDHFLTNIENAMKHAGYNALVSDVPVTGNDLDLTFSPQSLCKLDPIAWRILYCKFFRPHIQNTDQDHFARFLSIALSGSLRQARLYHLLPYHLRKMLWDGRLPWDFVEPYSRNLESLLHRLTLDSIFGAFRNGHTWQLKPSMNKIYQDYIKFRDSWKPVIDSEALNFIRLLNY